jgi:redox-sensitive bicupin YhaK (pirin superfamily)
VLAVTPLGFPWATADPFLFCVHHDDAYPRGNERMGPDASLAGRNIGQDFEGKDGWRMYHGDVVPGFPRHPHRGFETVTIVRRGFIDHADSLGATARFGSGDVQWLTAGQGIVHSEMFPLRERAGPNPVELFQIWLNLPAADKMAEPHFAMFWNHEIPRVPAEHGDGVEVTVIAGALAGRKPPSPPPRSWAAREDTDVAIWVIRLAAGTSLELPPAQPGSNRRLYFFSGSGLRMAGEAIPGHSSVDVQADAAVTLAAGHDEAQILLLQGRPIAEPVAQYGPFVMNTRAEVQQAFSDYQRTQFGGWPWPVSDPVHGSTEGRFARHADGRVERPAR